MAGRGPAPKDPARRVRHGGKDQASTTVLRFEQADAPDLPAELALHERVRFWWETWAESPQAAVFGSTDWLFLLETAYLAREFYLGDMTVAGELRLRVAKFGATPEDRARLRMQFAQADEADAKRPTAETSSRERRGALKALPAVGE